MERVTILNRDKKKIVVLLDQTERQKGLAFVAHGLGGTKDEPHIKQFAESLHTAGYTVVRWDARNTFGESEGSYEDATVSSYIADLEDVITWAEKQPWYQEPFVLAGHSLGGISILEYAERHPAKVRGLAPISTVISGKLSTETSQYTADKLRAWKESGWIIQPSRSGGVKKRKWAEMEDRLTYDTLMRTNKLTMPVLLIVGDKDEGTPPQHQRLLYDAIPHSHKELHILPGSDHVFRSEEELATIDKLFLQWLEHIP